jgi:hypothetical protein
MTMMLMMLMMLMMMMTMMTDDKLNNIKQRPTPDLLFSAHPPEHYSLSICRLCGESVPERSVRRHTAFCEAAHAGISGAGAVDRRVAAVAQALAGEAAGVVG